MLKIITKSAHNALLYQIEDLKKKLESANENIETYKEDLEQLEKGILSISGKYGEANGQKEQIRIELLTVKRKYNLCVTRHKSCVLRNEKLQKANTSLLNKNESLTAENHRLGNLLQVKCDEVKTLEKKIKEVEATTQYKDVLGVIEAHALNAQAETTTKHTFKKARVQEHLQSILEVIEANM